MFYSLFIFVFSFLFLFHALRPFQQTRLMC